MEIEIEDASVSKLQDLMAHGEVTSSRLVEEYAGRIEELDRNGPGLRSVLEINPDVEEIAAMLDGERAQGRVRGPLHGIPVLLKDSIDTADRMETTAGSLALLGSRPKQDAFVVRGLRDAGAVILGKANLSEWCNLRSTHSSSGWSARGGQGRNPYALDRSPCGSSSGSAVAVAANLVTVSLGTETDGSILCPASFNGVVGIKPTVGLTSRSGAIPIAHSQDTIGTLGRTVADAALALGAITGVDPDDPATEQSSGKSFTDYRQFLDDGGMKGARIGVCRESYFGYSEKADGVAEEALQVIRDLGAEIVDPADLTSLKELEGSESELDVLLYEFKADLNAYLRARPGAHVRSLEELIRFNEEHGDEELKYFGQEQFKKAQEKGPLTDEAYLEALEKHRRLSREEGIDALIKEHRLDALFMPTTGPAFKIDLIDGDHYMGSSSTPAALAGYPAISVLAGESFGLPIGITFMAGAFSEPVLIKLAYAFEQASRARRQPQFIPST